MKIYRMKRLRRLEKSEDATIRYKKICNPDVCAYPYWSAEYTDALPMVFGNYRSIDFYHIKEEL